MEPKSYQKGIEKTMEKRKATRPTNQNKTLRPRCLERVQTPGEGVGGGVNPSPREEGKGMRPVQRPKPPQPRGLVGFLWVNSGVTVFQFVFDTFAIFFAGERRFMSVSIDFDFFFGFSMFCAEQNIAMTKPSQQLLDAHSGPESVLATKSRNKAKNGLTNETDVTKVPNMTHVTKLANVT